MAAGRRKRMTVAGAILGVAIGLGGKPLLSSHGFQPLHSRPIQALSRPLPRIPFGFEPLPTFRHGVKLAPRWRKAFGRHPLRRTAFAIC